MKIKILQLDDETYAALNHVIDYVLEHEVGDFEENGEPDGHVYAFADLVANAIDAQATERPEDVPVRDFDEYYDEEA